MHLRNQPRQRESNSHA